MCDDHKHVDIVYTLANEALALYDDFDEQIFQKLNNQWQSCQLMLTTTGAAARGKRGARYCGQQLYCSCCIVTRHTIFTNHMVLYRESFQRHA